jgi:hypothetical protein
VEFPEPHGVPSNYFHTFIAIPFFQPKCLPL